MTMTRPVSPPGELISEELEARGWSQEDLAEIMGTSATLVSEVVNAKRSITPDTAALLARAFGTSTQLWLGLDARYHASLAKPDKASAAEARAMLYTKAPVGDMIKRGWIESSKNLDVLAKRVCEFFRIDSLDQPIAFDHAPRKSEPGTPTTSAQWAWLHRVRQLAPLVQVKSAWRPSSASDFARRLRGLAINPEGAQEVSRVMAEFGVRFVVVEPLPRSKIDGAAFWLADRQPVIAVSLRYDRIDNLWHTIMHEVDHIANNDDLSLDEEVLGEGEKPERETRADQFAVESLISQAALEDFCLRSWPLYSQVKIVGFAARMRIHPGIVVGQLHRRGPTRRGLEYTHFRKLLAAVRRIALPSSCSDGWGRAVKFGTSVKE
jgi:HTH-type transcriptional regulator/antitoxin HigA